jgi:DNA-binding transcriptional regulator YiaG
LQIQRLDYYPDAETISPSPRGRVALLGIAHRQIRVSRAHIPTDRDRRKPLPTNIKTLGDLIQIKRYEKRITLWQLALKTGIATATVRTWECGTDRPNEQQMVQLASVLQFNTDDMTEL